MVTRTVAVCLTVLFLVGASNSSRSTYVVRFSSAASSVQLTEAATSEFREKGFHRQGGGKEFQYKSAAIWVAISSGQPGELRLVFTQMRGGCGNNPEVAGAKEVVSQIRAALEAQFGPSEVSETHRANALSE